MATRKAPSLRWATAQVVRNERTERVGASVGGGVDGLKSSLGAQDVLDGEPF